MTEKTAGVDFETYYHEKHYSVSKMGNRCYVDDPRFDAYLVSVATSDGGEFCGHPSEFDFREIADYVWLSHNRAFDRAVYRKTCEATKTKPTTPANWHCTADMAGYLGKPRGLAKLLELEYGVKLDKGIRDAMSGREWEDLLPDQQGELIEYALEDVRYLPRLWDDFSPEWPEIERRVSQLTERMKRRGVPIDASKLDHSFKLLGRKMFEVEKEIPWWSDPEKRGKAKTPLSSLRLAEECRKRGLPVLASRAKEGDEAKDWIAEHGVEHTFVQAMQDWNSCNTLLKKLETLRSRVVFPERNDWAFDGEPREWRDGERAWAPFSMKYCGAHTGRDTSSEGLNMLNMNKTEVFGVDFRGHIVAPPGYVFLSADFSQIEPRVLAWLVGNEAFLDEVRNGVDPYVAFGLTVLNHKGDWTKADRQVWKIMVLQLGYQSGWKKYQMTAKAKHNLLLSNAEAKQHVTLFRTKNKKVTGFWRDLDNQMRAARVSKGGTGLFTIDMPSGRKQYYHNVVGAGSLKATVYDEGVQEKHFYGGMLAENVTQSVSRDIFMDAYARVEEAGIPIVLRIYDEFLALVPEKGAEKKAALMKEIMETPPWWAPDLPIGADMEVVKYYRK